MTPFQLLRFGAVMGVGKMYMANCVSCHGPTAGRSFWPTLELWMHRTLLEKLRKDEWISSLPDNCMHLDIFLGKVADQVEVKDALALLTLGAEVALGKRSSESDVGMHAETWEAVKKFFEPYGYEATSQAWSGARESCSVNDFIRHLGKVIETLQKQEG